jgi:hypothetical protein
MVVMSKREIANQRRGRPSNNRLPDVVRDHAIAPVQERLISAASA